MAVGDLSSVTLGEFEEMAARFGAALKVLHEARSLLGGAGVYDSPTPAAPVSQPLRAQVITRAELDAAPSQLSQEDQNYLNSHRAERERLARLNRPDPMETPQ